jgi:tRNA pseudouridine32 synthase/23S rRNA pseudouridine746 synthase
VNKNLQNLNGVGPSKVFLPEGPYLTVLDFLERRFPRGTRAGWEKRMLAGRVLNQDGQELHPDAPYLPRSTVYYYREVIENFVIPFQENIIYEDEYLLVLQSLFVVSIVPIKSLVYKVQQGLQAGNGAYQPLTSIRLHK